MRLKGFAITFFLLILLGCSNNVESAKFPPLDFRVQSELLDSLAVSFEGISLNMPRGSVAIPDSTLKAVRDQLQGVQASNITAYTIQKAYLAPATPPLIITLSTLNTPAPNDSAFGRFCDSYDSLMKAQNPNAETMTYSFNGLKCWQSKRIMSNQVSFRLLLADRAVTLPAQIDLTYPVSSSADWGRVVESVIGSVRIHSQGVPK